MLEDRLVEIMSTPLVFVHPARVFATLSDVVADRLSRFEGWQER